MSRARATKATAQSITFTEPMQCLAVSRLPSGPEWAYEVKLDGFRAQAVHTLDGLRFYSRNGKDFNRKYSALIPVLTRGIPLSAAVDGELCALDEQGRPSFNLLQNAPGNCAPLAYFAFDLLAINGQDLTRKPLSERRRLLTDALIEGPHLQLSADSDSPEALLAFVEKHNLEGIVAKKLTSCYEPGKRAGAWQKMRVNLQQEFVIGGFTHGVEPFDAVLIGFYRPAPAPLKPLSRSRRQYIAPPMPELIFCGSVRAGFARLTAASCTSASNR